MFVRSNVETNEVVISIFPTKTYFSLFLNYKIAVNFKKSVRIVHGKTQQNKYYWSEENNIFLKTEHGRFFNRAAVCSLKNETLEPIFLLLIQRKQFAM
jgi:hypothetical protein